MFESIKSWLGKPSKQTAKRNVDALALGMVSGLVGIVVLLVVILIEVVYKPEGIPPTVVLRLFEHLGVAAIVLGGVGIIIDFRHWQKYFQERLAETITGRNYLATLSKAQLISLQTDTLRAFFEVDGIDREESLLGYILTMIQGYIATPYREDTYGIVTLQHYGDRKTFTVEETISYKCRKVGVAIQNEVKWTVNKNFVQSIDEFWVSLQVPTHLYESLDFKSRHPRVPSAESTYRTTDHPCKLIADHTDTGFVLPLDDYKDIDELYVEVHVKYKLPCTCPLTWAMSHPSKNVTLTVTYPEELQLEMNPFGLQAGEYYEEARRGIYSFRYTSWLLPSAGLCCHIIKRSELTPELRQTQIQG